MGDATRTLRVGDIAPDFKLKSTGDTSFALSSNKGRANVALAFYPAAFSPVCSRETVSYTHLTLPTKRIV